MPVWLKRLPTRQMLRLRKTARRVLLFALCQVVVIFVRLALYVVKFSRIQKMLTSQRATNHKNEARAFIIARNVQKAARFVPNASCLTQALSAQAVLSWFGVPTEMVLGASKSNADPRLLSGRPGTDFHAWLTWKGQVILGGEELETQTFVPLSRFPTIETG
ncbi:MAG: lasso peptide biosynthesis B2 protein [Pseudomonadota bacterium]